MPLLFAIILLCHNQSFAQDTGIEPVEEVKEFKPFMVEHPFEGCPGGSACTKATGEQRKAWQDSLKKKPRRLKNLEAFRQQKGIPLAVWSRQISPVPTGLALWHSPCPAHNIEGKKIYLAETIAKNFSELSKNPHIIVRKSLVRDGAGNFIEYPILRGEAPLYIHKKQLYFNLDIEGEYFGLALDPSGAVTVVDPITPERFPENVACPPDLLKAFQALPVPPQFYQGASCSSIWDIDAKAFRTIVLGWSCG